MTTGLPYKPSEEDGATVRALKAFGHTDAEIAAFMRISHDTLERHHREDLDLGLTQANFKVANVLFKKCVEDEDTTSIIFWLKTRARWREAREEQKDNSLLEQLVAQMIENQKALNEKS
jgi:hypothetical protein